MERTGDHFPRHRLIINDRFSDVYLADTVLSAMQLLLALGCASWGVFWLPRLGSRPLSELANLGYSLPVPGWARSFYLSHGAVGLSSWLPPSSDPLTYAAAVVCFLRLLAALAATFAPSTKARLVPRG